jgi:transposase-like protein
MVNRWEKTRERMARVIARYRRSGQRRAEFARAAGITLSKLDYWTRRVARGNGRSAGAPRFVPVQLRVEDEAGADELEIALSSGERLRVGAGVSGERLREILAALRE